MEFGDIIILVLIAGIIYVLYVNGLLNTLPFVGGK